MTLDVDRVYGDIGEFGRGQRRFALGICLLNAYNAWHMLQYTFVGYDMHFECQAADQDTAHRDQCPLGLSSRCQVLSFPSSEAESTIVSEWGLVCDREYLSPLTMSLFMCGVMAGALAMGGMSDRAGRKRTTAVSLAGMCLVTAASAATDSFVFYTAMKIADGFFSAGLGLATFVLVNELVGASRRALIGNLIQGSFACGIILYAASASEVRHWRSLTWLSAALGVPMVGVAMWLPESPRWLLGKGRASEAVKVLKRIARMNGASLSERYVEAAGAAVTSPRAAAANKEKQAAAAVAAEGGSVMDLFKHRFLFVITMIQILSWFVNSATYYGLTLAASSESSSESSSSSSSGGSERYLKTALSGAVEIPAYVLTTMLLAKITRLWTLCGFMVSGGAALLAVLFTAPISATLVSGQALFCKLCISASFSVIYIHSGEVFPTSIRNTAIGLVSVAARLGGILAPFLVKLNDFSPNLHFLLFGGAMVASGALNARLPETQGLPMPETVQDLLKRHSGQVKPLPVFDNSSKKGGGEGYKMLPTDEYDFEHEEGIGDAV